MAIRTVTDAIRYVGADDNTLTLFENQYPVQPMGVSYNSYVILDEKIAVMDSVDARAAEEWLSHVAQVLEGRSPDYLVVTHMEPDHSGSLMVLREAEALRMNKSAAADVLCGCAFIHSQGFSLTPVSYTHLTLPTILLV